MSMGGNTRCRAIGIVLCVGLVAVGGTARADPTIQPPIAAAGKPQTFTLVVPRERVGGILRMVELYPPPDLAIKSFSETDGWHRDWTIVSMQVPVQKATWTRVDAANQDPYYAKAATTNPNTDSGSAMRFRFVAAPAEATAYPVEVRETYSIGKVIHWRGTTSYAFPTSPPGATIRPPIVLGSTTTSGGRPYGWIALAVGCIVAICIAVGLSVRARTLSRSS
jgi:hypothetical protein